MPELLEYDVCDIAFTWLNSVILAVAIVTLCGGACVCFDPSLIIVAVDITLFALNTVQRTLNALLQTIKGHFSVGTGAATNHHILNIRPEYGGEFSKLINDIVGVLLSTSFDHRTPEKRRKHRNLPRKFDTKGWRRVLNKRWKTKMERIKAFMRAILSRQKHKQMAVNSFQGESNIFNTEGNSFRQENNSQEESMENSSHSNSRESNLEKFIMPIPQRVTDLTHIRNDQPRKITMLKVMPNGKRICHWE